MPYSYRSQITQQENPQLILSTGKAKYVYKLSKQSYELWCENSSFKMFSERISHTRTQRSYGTKCKYNGKKHLLGIPTFHLEMNITSIFQIWNWKTHKSENILVIGTLNSKKKIQDRSASNNSRMGLILEEIINRHGFYIITTTDITYQQSVMASKSGKSTIDLTLTRGLKNIKVVKKCYLNKTSHKAIKVLIEQEPSFKPNPKFRTKNADQEKWKQFLQAPVEHYSTNFPLEI